MRGWAVVLAVGTALAVTSLWHDARGGWWPPVVLVAVCVAVAVGVGISRRGGKQ